MSDSPNSRGSFATNYGFILAAAGSAVGLGNIWKFPYITGEYGGGAFVLAYLGCIAVVGLPLMYAELIIGQRGKASPSRGIRTLVDGPFGALSAWVTGGLAVGSGFLILSFYSVVAGWALHYLAVSVGVMSGGENAGETFGQLTGNWNLTAAWHTLFMAMTVGVVIGGVQSGIERACKILMPGLFAILIILLAYTATTHGLGASLSFLFKPDFSKLTFEALLEALGHSFFTLSLGMGAMITYGSYLKEERAVVRDGLAVAILDTVVALLAGTVIFAVVFGLGREPEAGPGLVFVTLPDLFSTMPGGGFVAVAFFVMLVFAAWSSAISLLEVVVAFGVDEFGIPRRVLAPLAGLSIWAVGLLCADLENGWLDSFDQWTTNYMLPLGGILVALVAAWLLKPEDRDAGFNTLGDFGTKLIPLWTWITRIITPILVAAVIAGKIGLLDGFLGK